MTRRANPLETRCRELAIAAGLDPDGRATKPGSDRGMPVWCTFTEAARPEQNESPMAYRRLPDVLAHHTGSVKVLHTLRPFAVAMAGASEFDPFKD